MTRQP